MSFAVGFLAILFVRFQRATGNIFKVEGLCGPGRAHGIPCGIAASVTSSFAHGAGPAIRIF
jgi:hypothetical protein